MSILSPQAYPTLSSRSAPPKKDRYTANLRMNKSHNLGVQNYTFPTKIVPSIHIKCIDKFINTNPPTTILIHNIKYRL